MCFQLSKLFQLQRQKTKNKKTKKHTVKQKQNLHANKQKKKKKPAFNSFEHYDLFLEKLDHSKTYFT